MQKEEKHQAKFEEIKNGGYLDEKEY